MEYERYVALLEKRSRQIQRKYRDYEMEMQAKLFQFNSRLREIRKSGRYRSALQERDDRVAANMVSAPPVVTETDRSVFVSAFAGVYKAKVLDEQLPTATSSPC